MTKTCSSLVLCSIKSPRWYSGGLVVGLAPRWCGGGFVVGVWSSTLRRCPFLWLCAVLRRQTHRRMTTCPQSHHFLSACRFSSLVLMTLPNATTRAPPCQGHLCVCCVVFFLEANPVHFTMTTWSSSVLNLPPVEHYVLCCLPTHCKLIIAILATERKLGK